MKLRNKKTGEIITLDSEHINGLVDFGGKILVQTVEKEFSYGTLAKLNEDWEDYTPAEPLIKDDKIRKAVRAWAEANSICRAIHYKTAVGTELIEINYEQPTDQKAAIEFNKYCGLEESKEYAIDELCGEEE